MPGDAVSGAAPILAARSGMLSVVVPCYNERETVRTILERVVAAPMPDGWEREIIVVDDASTDGTRNILDGLDLPVRVLYRETNGGKGTALIDGFRAAQGTHFLIQDADLEYDPNDIASLVSALENEKTVVYGSRYLRAQDRTGSVVLRAGVYVLTQLINVLYGAKLTDTSTCYKLFPRAAAALFPAGGLEADSVFAAILIRAGFSIREVPISYRPRTIAEGKKIKYRDGIRAAEGIVRLYLRG